MSTDVREEPLAAPAVVPLPRVDARLEQQIGVSAVMHDERRERHETVVARELPANGPETAA